MAYNPVWAWNHLLLNLGLELVLLAGFGTIFCRLPRFAFWWMRCCITIGLATAYGALLSEISPGKSLIFYFLCGSAAVVYLATGRDRPWYRLNRYHG